MLPVNEALNIILSQAKTIQDIDHVCISDAVGFTLGQDQFSAIDVPPADNSAMDGYALNTASLQQDEKTSSNITLPISQTITAGSPPLPLVKNTAARIFTGAKVPEGANAVVMQELCDIIDNKEAPAVSIPQQITPGNNIRKQGQDIKSGDCILFKGRQLQAQDCGLLASVGLDTVPVYRRLKIAILSTGNELVEPGHALGKGKIYNSNRYLLKGLLKQLGWDIMDIGVVKDSLVDTRTALNKASEADCIISTGGVSVGEEDYIKQAVAELGELTLWRIALKPGKPLAFGHINETPFFGLPGNPVSSFLTFLLFVKPFLSVLQGQHYKAPISTYYKANFSVKANPKRQEYIRVSFNIDYNNDNDSDSNSVSAFPNQSSGVLSSIVKSDAFAIIPINTDIEYGDRVEVIPFSHFLN